MLGFSLGLAFSKKNNIIFIFKETKKFEKKMFCFYIK